MKYLFFFTAALFLLSCGTSGKLISYNKQDNLIRVTGRADHSSVGPVTLFGSASSVTFIFAGKSCEVMLRKLNPEGENNYATFELDGDYYGRYTITSRDYEPFRIEAENNSESHMFTVYKATEAANNYIVFGGVKAKKLNPLPEHKERKIEFIGNSITCNMGGYDEEIPCGEGTWFDQHDAYFGYGPRVARALDADFMLSSVSGIGVYRNWNSEGPTMPKVYENTRLDLNKAYKWSFSRFQPDLVSIALGTNDFSNGDGEKERQPFSVDQFVSNYVKFINLIHSKYPNAKIALLTSPMMKGNDRARLFAYLNQVKDELSNEGLTINIHFFPEMETHGCSGHPDNNDQALIAESLIPFYKEVMGW